MHWLSILLIAVASNLDNLGIGVSLGIRSTRVSSASNALIALITMTGTFLSMCLGQSAAHTFFGHYANSVGAFIIVALGCWTLASFLLNKWKEKKSFENNVITHLLQKPQQAGAKQYRNLSWKKSLSIGIALAMNNMATGLGAGATGLFPLATTLFTGAFSFLFMGLSSYAGLRMSKCWVGIYSDLIAGILMIFIGFYELFV